MSSDVACCPQDDSWSWTHLGAETVVSVTQRVLIRREFRLRRLLHREVVGTYDDGSAVAVESLSHRSTAVRMATCSPNADCRTVSVALATSAAKRTMATACFARDTHT